MTRHSQKQIAQIGNRVKAPESKKRVRSITDAARALGVSREHLSRVLHGHRRSRSLLARYEALSE